jgi:hypothetical protein
MVDASKPDRLPQEGSAPVNITIAEWDPSGWKKAPAEDAVHSLFVYANGGAKRAVAWYERAKHRKAVTSLWLRGLAIVLIVVGGLAPILAGFMHDDLSTAYLMVIVTQSGYTMLGVAAGLVLFDRYFGMSSGWIRYMTSLAAIERLRAEFLFDWTALLQKAPAPIDDATKLLFLSRAQAFQKGVLEVIEKETAGWVAEFQSSVADLEKVVQAQRQAAEANVQAARKQEDEMRTRLKTEDERAAAARRSSAINLELAGDLEGQSEILLDDAKVKETSGRTAALLNLPSGQHAIEVRSTAKGGKPVSASKVVTLEPGMIADLKLTPH